MENWERRLKHERDCRDGLVACGNTPPEKPDPEGGFFTVQARVFKGKVFFPFIKERGHTSADYYSCKC